MRVFLSPNSGTGLIVENLELALKLFPNISKKFDSVTLSLIKSGISSLKGKVESCFFLL
jgi:hypothetical protein